MTKEEYGDFVLRYKGCGACFPMYHTLSRFERMWFSAIQKDVADIEKENATLKEDYECLEDAHNVLNELYEKLEKENAELKRENRGIKTCANCDEYVIGRCCNYPNGVCHHWKLLEKYKNDDELTNAKEIIKKLLSRLNRLTYTGLNCEECKEAEQFLKECK